MSLDILHRSHPLRLSRHGPAQDLEVQLFNPQLLREWVEDPEPVVGGIDEPPVGVFWLSSFRGQTSLTSKVIKIKKLCEMNHCGDVCLITDFVI